MNKPEYATVVLPRVPDDEDELELCTGDNVKVLQKFNNGWFKGAIDDNIGMFPGSHVKFLKPLFSVRVVYKYEAQMPDELMLNVGDVINVLDDNLEDVGWWFGEMAGQGGMFPNNFVERIKQPVLNQAVIRKKSNVVKSIESCEDNRSKSSSQQSNYDDEKSDEQYNEQYLQQQQPQLKNQQPQQNQKLTNPVVMVQQSSGVQQQQFQQQHQQQHTAEQQQHPYSGQLSDRQQQHLPDIQQQRQSPATKRRNISPMKVASNENIQHVNVNEMKEDLAKIRFNFEWFSMKHAKIISQLVEEVEQEKMERRTLEIQLNELNNIVANKFNLKL